MCIHALYRHHIHTDTAEHGMLTTPTHYHIQYVCNISQPQRVVDYMDFVGFPEAQVLECEVL